MKENKFDTVKKAGNKNSIEDIKNIEEIIELSKEEIDAKDENITAILDIEDLISLEHILQDYKRVLKENAELKNKLKEKDKIIDEMSDWLYGDDTSFGNGKLKEVNTKERIVKFFENKTEQKQ